MTGPPARAAVRRAVRACRQSLQAVGATRDEAYRDVLARARAGAFGAVPIGWVHEDFHLDEKDAAFAAARVDGVKIGSGQLVAASRIYTPPDIVDLLLQNSLGALWLSMHPTSSLRAAWPLYVPDAAAPPTAPRPVRALSVLDPCCGCGAFLLPALDMLVAMAAEERRMVAAAQLPADWPAIAAEVTAATIVGDLLWGADLDGEAVALLRAEFRRRGGAGADNLRVPVPPLGSLDRAIFADRRFDVVCTNPPYVGFRQLAPEVKQAVREADPRARSDLAVAFQRRCVELTAPGGRCATVTPAGWTNGRESLPLREEIVARGGPVLMVPLGQRVFDTAPLLFVTASVVAVGATPEQVVVMRPNQRSGQGVASAIARATCVPLTALRRLAALPFVTDAPPELLALAGGTSVGDRLRSSDGLWTGDNARDLRYWWQLDDPTAWVAVSGGQGCQPWATPVRLRIHPDLVGTTPIRSGGVEYPRVAGGRLSARVVPSGTVALAGVVTFVPRSEIDDARLDELLALCNSAIGAAWLRTLTSGLNFNPGYAAQMPVGTVPPGVELRAAVGAAVALRQSLVQGDLTHDAFVNVLLPDEVADCNRRLRAVESEIDDLLADHLALPRRVVRALPPVSRPRRDVGGLDDALLVAVLRALGFRWPGGPAATDAGDPEAQVANTLALWGERMAARAWLQERLGAHASRRFRGAPILTHEGTVRLLPRTG